LVWVGGFVGGAVVGKHLQKGRGRGKEEGGIALKYGWSGGAYQQRGGQEVRKKGVRIAGGGETRVVVKQGSGGRGGKNASIKDVDSGAKGRLVLGKGKVT